jgi:hypothetical protein
MSNDTSRIAIARARDSELFNLFSAISPSEFGRVSAHSYSDQADRPIDHTGEVLSQFDSH